MSVRLSLVILCDIMEAEREVVSDKYNETPENDEEERKHFCKVISAFRSYRLVQLLLYDF